MSDEFGPFVRRKLLGRQLRQLREQAGVYQEAAAKFAGLKGASISRIENGKQVILARTVRSLCQCYNVGAPTADMLIRQAEESNDRAWYSMYSDTVPSWVESFLGLEAEATEVWSYEALFMPGLLQTPGYVRAVAEAARVDSADPGIERSVELRLARQRRLQSDHPPRLQAVLDEAVLRRTVGSAEIMADQIRHLIDMAGRDHIAIQVLPFGVGAYAAMTGAFTMLRFPDELEMNAVFLEHDHGATSAERPTDLDRYGRMFQQAASLALSTDQSRELLVTLGEVYIRANNERGA